MVCHSSFISRPMRAVCLGTALLGLCDNRPAVAQSEWLESGRLSVTALRGLCERITDVRHLALMQMITTGNAHWRQLSRQELVIEAAGLGVPPLDPNRCYVVARAGPKDKGEHRAFEVHDFAVNPERTSVFIVGRAYDLPSEFAPVRILCPPTNC